MVNSSPTEKEAKSSNNEKAYLATASSDHSDHDDKDDEDDDHPRYLGYPFLPLKQQEEHLLQIRIPREVGNLLAGGVAGMVAKSVVAPVDRIKILYQTSNATFRFSKIPKVAWRIIQEEGLQALWKGNTATMVRVFPYAGIQFMVFDACKRYFLKQQQQHNNKRRGVTTIPHYDTTTPSAADTSTATKKDKMLRRYSSASIVGLSPLESLLAGSIAGAVSVTCTYPLDLTRAQLAVLKRKRHGGNAGFMQILIQNHQRAGFVGLFRGITPTMLGILPYSGVAFAMNEQAKHYITKRFRRDPTTIERMQCGALSGLCAQTITYPLEVTRRRMQTIGMVGSGTTSTAAANGTTATKASTEIAPGNMVGTMRFLWQEQGMRGFFKGVSMNWLKGPIAFSISFTTFDVVQAWVLGQQPQHQKRN